MNKVLRRKNHFVIEFSNYRSQFWMYGIKKLLAFLVDITFYLCFILLFDLIFHFPILNNLLLSYFLFLGYLTLVCFLLKKQTCGLFLGGLVIGSYDGKEASQKEKCVRVFLGSLYALPIIGALLLLISLISIILNKGLSWIDVFSKTQVFSKSYYLQIGKIYTLIEKERS